MSSLPLVRRLVGVFCLLFLVMGPGCQAVRPRPSDGYWAQQATQVAQQRLRAEGRADSGGGFFRDRAGLSVCAAGGSSTTARDAGATGGSSASAKAHASGVTGGLPASARADASFMLASSQILAVTMPDPSDSTTASLSEAAPGSPTTQTAAERGPPPGFFETLVRDGKRTPRELWRDTKNVYTNTPNLVILGLAGAASIALHPEVDHQIARHFEHHHILQSGARSTFEILGNPGIHWAVAGTMYIASQQFQATKEYEVARTLASALIINDLTTMAFKAAAWQKDPSGVYFGWPSGHTSSTMTVAAVVHQAYGPLAATPLYGVTTLVAIERLDDHDHWFSDVIFGGVMGWVIGHTVAGGRLPEINGGQIVPYVDPVTGAAGVAWWKSF